jgi:uncharacterized protein (DUF362 family)
MLEQRRWPARRADFYHLPVAQEHRAHAVLHSEGRYHGDCRRWARRALARHQDDVGKVITLPLARDAHHGGFRTIGLLPNMEGLVPPKKQEKSNDLHA